MKHLAILALLLASPAFAEDAKKPEPKPEAPATVTLTAQELQALVNAEVSKALAGQQAKDVYDKVNAALVPKPEPKKEK